MTDETLRETLEKSYEKVEPATTEEGGGPPASSEEPIRSAAPEKDPTEPDKPSDEKPDTEEGQKVAEGTKGEQSAPAPDSGDDEIKTAPSSWRATERELWGSASPELKRVIARREKDIQKLLERQSTEGRFRSSFEQVIAPFQKYIQAQGGNPFKSIHNLMTTAATLQDGSAHQKASLVTDLINSFKIDVQLLDEMLARSVKPKGPLSAEDIRGVVREEFRSFQPPQPQLESQATNVESDVSAFFKDPANEYANDVALDMADLLEMAGRRGEKMTLKEAYDRACALNPDVQKLKQRKQQEELSRKKAAASSLPSNTTSTKHMPKVTPSSSMREDIEAAIAQLSSR